MRAAERCGTSLSLFGAGFRRTGPSGRWLAGVWITVKTAFADYPRPRGRIFSLVFPSPRAGQPTEEILTPRTIR